jgi:predicted ATP-grasp superfamily ATP-dependent carboligase
MAPKVVVAYQTDNLRYTLSELNNYDVCTWQVHTSKFLDQLLPNVPDNIENFEINTQDRSVLAEEIRQIIKENNIDYIFPLYNDMLLPYIHDLVGITKEQSDILSNKQRYTEYAYKLGIPVPRTQAYIAKFPVIAKPANGTGGIGIKVLNNDSEYEHFKKDIHYNDLDSHYIFQEVIEGPTVSVSGRVVNGECIIDCVYDIEVSNLPFRAETGFTWPSKSSILVQNDIKGYCRIMCESLGYNDGPFMADFVVQDETAYLVDFSPRLSTSGQTIIKYSADCDYNRIVMDSISCKSNLRIHMDKAVVFRYFDIEKGNYRVSMRDGAEYLELSLPLSQQYLRRMVMLVGMNGYAITSDKRLLDAELKWQSVLAHIELVKQD